MKTIDIMAIPELYNVVYMLTNPLGERYIGSAVDLRHRMGRYRSGYGHGLIGESILKYGFENHTLSILAKNISDKNLRAREYKFIEEIQPELNLITPNAGGFVRHAESSKRKMSEIKKGVPVHTPESRAKISAGNKGKIISSETRAKMSAAAKGRKHSPEARAKMSAAHSNPSPEIRAKMSAAQKGRKHSAEARAKISAGNKGIPKSAEARAKMSAAAKGRKYSPEARAKMSAAQKGRKHSAEARAKISAANIGRKHTPEARAKMSAARKGIKIPPEHVAKSAAARRESCRRRNHKRDKKIIAMRKKGKSYQEIADCIGLPKGSVGRICRQHQVEISEQVLATQLGRQQKRDKKIISMRKKGKPLQEIADCVGLTISRISQICRQINR